MEQAVASRLLHVVNHGGVVPDARRRSGDCVVGHKAEAGVQYDVVDVRQIYRRGNDRTRRIGQTELDIAFLPIE